MPEVLYCFTDGACLAPACPVGKLASWGVILAFPDQETFWPVSSGLVPGWVQTALRGEIWAVISACTLAIATSKPLYLWTDNDLVFKRVKQFQVKRESYKAQSERC
jgi:ribonuclease HI